MLETESPQYELFFTSKIIFNEGFEGPASKRKVKYYGRLKLIDILTLID